MKVKIIFGVFLFFLDYNFATLSIFNKEFRKNNNTASYLNALQTIRKYGYPAEGHIVETPDGYLLALHRIKHEGYNNTEKPRNITSKYPVLFMHGIFGSSEDFLMTGPGKGLPYILADLGFDVWLGNVRGNTYSRAHVNMFPENSSFWDFSFHENALYDVTTNIDFILNETKQEKVIYVGFSMGSTEYFILNSISPEYNEKIKVGILLAPIAFLQNARSPIVKYFVRTVEALRPLGESVFTGEILPKDQIAMSALKFITSTSKLGAEAYKNFLLLSFGYDPVQFDETLMNSIIDNYPVGYSKKGVAHYSQLGKHGRFCQFDYGPMKNEKVYNMSTPPDYNLKNIKVPTYMYVGKNDLIATVEDAELTKSQISSVKRFRVLDFPLFAHLDFIIAKDIRKLLNDIVINDLIDFLNSN